MPDTMTDDEPTRGPGITVAAVLRFVGRVIPFAGGSFGLQYGYRSFMDRTIHIDETLESAVIFGLLAAAAWPLMMANARRRGREG